MNLFSNTIIPHFKLRDAWNILWVYKKLTQKDGEEIFLGKNEPSNVESVSRDFT